MEDAIVTVIEGGIVISTAFSFIVILISLHTEVKLLIYIPIVVAFGFMLSAIIYIAYIAIQWAGPFGSFVFIIITASILSRIKVPTKM
jgi:hypothetical protein